MKRRRLEIILSSGFWVGYVLGWAILLGAIVIYEFFADNFEGLL